MRRVATGLGISLAGFGTLLVAGALAFVITFDDAVFATGLWGIGLLLAGSVTAGMAHWGPRGALVGIGVTFLVLGFGVTAAAVTFQQGLEQYFALSLEKDAFEGAIAARLAVGAGLMVMFAGAIAIALFAYVNQQAERGDAGASDASVDTAHAPLREP